MTSGMSRNLALATTWGSPFNPVMKSMVTLANTKMDSMDDELTFVEYAPEEARSFLQKAMETRRINDEKRDRARRVELDSERLEAEALHARREAKTIRDGLVDAEARFREELADAKLACAAYPELNAQVAHLETVTAGLLIPKPTRSEKKCRKTRREMELEHLRKTLRLHSTQGALEVENGPPKPDRPVPPITGSTSAETRRRSKTYLSELQTWTMGEISRLRGVLSDLNRPATDQ